MRSATGSYRSGLVLGVVAASARRSSWLLRTPVVGALALLTQLLTVSPSEAQLQNAQVQGTISDARSRKGLTGATVTITGPAIPELQAEITDARGHYLITQLPPGDDYVIRIYYGGAEEPQLVRTGLRLSVGKTVTVDASLRTSQTPSEVKVIVEKAPNLDTASATTGVTRWADALAFGRQPGHRPGPHTAGPDDLPRYSATVTEAAFKLDDGFRSLDLDRLRDLFTPIQSLCDCHRERHQEHVCDAAAEPPQTDTAACPLACSSLWADQRLIPACLAAYSKCDERLACAQSDPLFPLTCPEGQIHAFANNACFVVCDAEHPCASGTCTPWHGGSVCVVD